MSHVSQLVVQEAVASVPSTRADLEQLVSCHFAFIWRLLRRLGLPPSDADDAAQQVFLIAGAKLEKIQAGRERAFLYGCALHRASKWQRGRARERRSVSLDADAPTQLPCPALSAEDQLGRSEARVLLDAILAEMPVSLRSVFVLFELEQLGSLEIAELLGLPRGTVASRLRRAREDFEKRVKRLESRTRHTGGGR
jgi:RNA polymerase sigma-70 factor (ECF subfamily)